jgi:hypothetical protein
MTLTETSDDFFTLYTTTPTKRYPFTGGLDLTVEEIAVSDHIYVSNSPFCLFFPQSLQRPADLITTFTYFAAHTPIAC